MLMCNMLTVKVMMRAPMRTLTMMWATVLMVFMMTMLSDADDVGEDDGVDGAYD